jgi:hypothetical protein
MVCHIIKSYTAKYLFGANTILDFITYCGIASESFSDIDAMTMKEIKDYYLYDMVCENCKRIYSKRGKQNGKKTKQKSQVDLGM